ncbi:SDR family oxidoreductase [Lentibacillus halophilus]|uniref:SDR family oxidoreductase n=1 Tax=Lentibacillus halophilus TaxID=295065 RepID=A0ABN0Z2N5_9BACI
MGHALITAGTSGLGRQVTEKFLMAGHRVTATYHRDGEKAQAVKTELAPYRDLLHTEQVDVTDKQDLTRLTEQAVNVHGGIDYLVNNAGPFIFNHKKLLDYTDGEWQEMVNGNLDAAFHLLQLTVPHMRQQQFGRIINYGFQGANHASGWPYRSAFAAAKSGLASLTKTVAAEEAPNRITANMVCPGDITGDMKEAGIDASRNVHDDTTPIGRPGTGEDIARTIMYLCDQDSDMITGAIMDITGGVDVKR